MHGLDYYAGREATEPGEYEARIGSRRALRGPRPEEGEQADEANGESSLVLSLLA